MNQTPRLRSPLDRLAITFSSVCALHCVLVVLAVGTIPLWGLAWITAPNFHEWFLAIAIVPSTLALWWGFRQHADRRVIFGGVAAFLLMGTAIALRESGLISALGESGMTLSGAVLLAGTHLHNLRRSH